MPSLKSIDVVVGILGREAKFTPPPSTNATIDTPCTIGLICEFCEVTLRYKQLRASDGVLHFVRVTNQWR